MRKCVSIVTFLCGCSGPFLHIFVGAQWFQTLRDLWDKKVGRRALVTYLLAAAHDRGFELAQPPQYSPGFTPHTFTSSRTWKRFKVKPALPQIKMVSYFWQLKKESMRKKLESLQRYWQGCVELDGDWQITAKVSSSDLYDELRAYRLTLEYVHIL